jgi:hypothetical protein
MLPVELQSEIATHMDRDARQRAFPDEVNRCADARIESMVRQMHPIQDRIRRVIEAFNATLDQNVFCKDRESVFNMVPKSMYAAWPCHWDGPQSGGPQLGQRHVDAISPHARCVWAANRLYEHCIRVELGSEGPWTYVLEIVERCFVNDEESILDRYYTFVMSAPGDVRYKISICVEDMEFPSEFILSIVAGNRQPEEFRQEDYLPVLVFLRTMLEAQEAPYLSISGQCCPFSDIPLRALVTDCHDLGLK